MPYWAVYEAVSGELRSHGTVIANPLPPGMEAKDVVSPPGDKLWNKTTRAFDPRPADPLRNLVTEFTAQPEIQALTNANRTKVLDALRRVIPDWMPDRG